MTEITIRPGTPADADECGRICHDAFEAIAARHGFPKDFPSCEVAARGLRAKLSHPSIYGAVAERDRRILGSNFLDERCVIRSIGPISVDPAVQDSSIGRRLMQALLGRAEAQKARGVRLLQDAYHNRSFALYTKLGFQMRVTASVITGNALALDTPGCSVRTVTEADLPACNDLCIRTHGFDRGLELADAVRMGTARLVEREGRVTGYVSMLGVGGHAVGETNLDLQALIAAAQRFDRLGFLVPNDNPELLRWCFANDLRMVKAMTLMSLGEYQTPAGPYLPSVMF